VVFRWVGVAAPAQRCFQGISQRMSGSVPRAGRFCLRCPAGGRAFTHSGGGRSGYGEMVEPPSSIAGYHKPDGLAIFESVTLGSPLDPVVGGRLRTPFTICFHGASGACRWQVPFTRDILKCQRHVSSVPYQRSGCVVSPNVAYDARAEGSDLQCRKCAAPHSVAVS
jgi:hypothetical protein